MHYFKMSGIYYSSIDEERMTTLDKAVSELFLSELFDNNNSIECIDILEDMLGRLFDFIKDKKGEEQIRKELFALKIYVVHVKKSSEYFNPEVRLAFDAVSCKVLEPLFSGKDGPPISMQMSTEHIPTSCKA